MKAQEPELNALFFAGRCLPQRGVLEGFEAVPAIIRTFDDDRVFGSDAAIGEIQ